MRAIVSRYPGSCAKCGEPFEVGAEIMYEKQTGTFCHGCEPADPEEIRAYRQARADPKADRLEASASRLRGEAEAKLKSCEPYTSDHAFNTQPGHIPIRARIIARQDRAYRLLDEADEKSDRADRLRQVRVAGDAERARQAKREANDAIITKASRIRDHVFGTGTVTRVNQKTYTIRFDSGGTWPRDKSYVTSMEGRTDA